MIRVTYDYVCDACGTSIAAESFAVSHALSELQRPSFAYSVHGGRDVLCLDCMKPVLDAYAELYRKNNL